MVSRQPKPGRIALAWAVLIWLTLPGVLNLAEGLHWPVGAERLLLLMLAEVPSLIGLFLESSIALQTMAHNQAVSATERGLTIHSSIVLGFMVGGALILGTVMSNGG